MKENEMKDLMKTLTADPNVDYGTIEHLAKSGSKESNTYIVNIVFKAGGHKQEEWSLSGYKDEEALFSAMFDHYEEIGQRTKEIDYVTVITPFMQEYAITGGFE